MGSETQDRRNKRLKYIAIAVAAMILISLIVGLAIGLRLQESDNGEGYVKTIEGISLSAEIYKNAAVATDYPLCSVVGKDILKKGGSAVDAAIASLICIGTCQFQSSGIGGGGFMLVYIRSNKSMDAFDYRETGPGNITDDSFNDGSDRRKVGRLFRIPMSKCSQRIA